MTSPVRLTLAVSDYDHVRDLTSGRVAVEGVELTCLQLPVEEIFFRFTAFREWHVSELSLTKYVAMAGAGDTSVAAIPVFPSRVFRHSAFYVARDGPVREVGDLAGARIGVPEWFQTAGVWARGLLVHEFGLRLTDMHWFQAGVNQPGRVEKVGLNLPHTIRYGSRPDRSLNEMLLSGEIDAAFSARPPESFLQGDPRIIRLFPDFRVREEAYFAATGIFPIMHLLSIRRSVLDAYPWVAMNLLTAFEEAKDAAVRRALEITTSRSPVPWGVAHADEVAKLMGGDPWPYGVESNLNTLNAFCRFAHDQYVTPTLLRVEDLFPKEVIGKFKV